MGARRKCKTHKEQKVTSILERLRTYIVGRSHAADKERVALARKLVGNQGISLCKDIP